MTGFARPSVGWIDLGRYLVAGQEAVLIRVSFPSVLHLCFFHLSLVVYARTSCEEYSWPEEGIHTSALCLADLMPLRRCVKRFDNGLVHFSVCSTLGPSPQRCWRIRSRGSQIGIMPS